MTLSELFKQYIETEDIDLVTERELILQAQDGSEEAYHTLLKMYAPALKKNSRGASSEVDQEDVQAATLLGFVEAIHQFDPDKHVSLGAVIGYNLKRSLSEVGATSANFYIPSRSLSRWAKIMREANQNIYEAMALAPKYSMTQSTFLDIHKALKETGSLEAVMIGGDFVTRSIHVETREPVGEADQELVRIVFESKGDENDLNAREAEILYRAYGFLNYGDPQSDDAVGAAMGLSRTTIQRVRSSALAKARIRLGA